MEVRYSGGAARVSGDLTGDLQGLIKKAEKAGQSLAKAARSRANILLVAQCTADGILCSSIVAEAILRKEGRFVVRSLDESSSDTFESLSKENFDIYVFCSTSYNTKDLDETFKAKWLSFQDNYASGPLHEQALNPWDFNFQGGGETTASGMAYLTAKSLDESLIGAAWMPVTACLSEGLDGSSRRLSGLGKMFVNDAIESHCLSLSEGLILYGAESKPLHLALASTTRPFIPILVGSRDGCLATLNSTGVRLKDDSIWRALKDFSKEEVEAMTNVLQPLLVTESSSLAVSSFFAGEIYVLPSEEKGSSLRDAREYADLLQACCCTRRLAEAVSICLGERGGMLADAERVLVKHRERLKTIAQRILKAEPEAVEGAVFVGDLDVDARFLRALVGAMAAVPKLYGKVVLLGSVPRDGKVAIHVKASLDADLLSIRIGEAMREAVNQVEAQGSGNVSGGWAVVEESKVQGFVKAFRKGLRGQDEGRSAG
ncbi:MAG: hypothetical protein HYU39_03020 [Thaumarchaeota archaeon]|nr:hypothetical protein [Nitrososphaerota archaeon]